MSSGPQVDCVDPHSGISNVTLSIGTFESGSDVTVVSLPVSPALVTYRGGAVFVPVSGTTYYADFSVTNGVGLATDSISDGGLLYTTQPPQTRMFRGGWGLMGGGRTGICIAIYAVVLCEEPCHAQRTWPLLSHMAF